jgi:hypothetical protein
VHSSLKALHPLFCLNEHDECDVDPAALTTYIVPFFLNSACLIAPCSSVQEYQKIERLTADHEARSQGAANVSAVLASRAEQLAFGELGARCGLQSCRCRLAGRCSRNGRGKEGKSDGGELHVDWYQGSEDILLGKRRFSGH